MKTLQDLFNNELADIYDAEHRLIHSLPKLAKAATCDHLQRAILQHLRQTEEHVTKIEHVFACFELTPKREKCDATVGLITEADELTTMFKESPVINAAIIAAAQKIEHYEIASYGCLHEWAGVLGNKKAADILMEILTEEKAANDSLTELARIRSNEEACKDESTKPVTAKKKTATQATA